ncbi:hypothetical protein [Agarilytica rhodophyticola]|nr:hypothetical protein [Agarilytica rhodophyticola]
MSKKLALIDEIRECYIESLGIGERSINDALQWRLLQPAAANEES